MTDTPTPSIEEVKEREFIAQVWSALKGDHNDLRREAIILGAFRATITALQSELAAVFQIAEAAPELNMSNYDHDQVAELNTAMCEIYNILHATLKDRLNTPKDG